MRFKQVIYESTQAPLARPLFSYAGNAPKQPSSHQSLAIKKGTAFAIPFFYFLSPP